MEELEKILTLLLDNNLITEEITASMESIKNSISGMNAGSTEEMDALKAENETLMAKVSDLEILLASQKQMFTDAFFGRVTVQADGTTKTVTETSAQGVVDYSTKTLDSVLEDSYE